MPSTLGTGKPSLLALMWDLMAKPSITRTASCYTLWYVADSHSVTLLSKLYLYVSTTLFLVLYNAGFGSDSVMGYADIIHKRRHQDKWVTDRYNTNWLSYVLQLGSTRQVPHSLLPVDLSCLCMLHKAPAMLLLLLQHHSDVSTFIWFSVTVLAD